MNKVDFGHGVIYEGDCLEVLPILSGQSIDLIVTDPPYNVSKQGGNLQNILNGKKHGGKNAGRRDFGEWDYHFNPQIYVKYFDSLLSNNGQSYIFGLTDVVELWLTVLKERFDGVKLMDWIKPDPVPQIRQRHWCSANEFFIWAWRGKYTFNYLGHRKMFTYQFYQAPKQQKERIHPTQKPLKLIEKLILVSSNPNETVLDCFLGSGTTAVAAYHTGRRWIGIEKEPKYFDLACQRIENEMKQPSMFDEWTQQNNPLAPALPGC